MHCILITVNDRLLAIILICSYFASYLSRHTDAEFVVADVVVVRDGAALDDERGPRHGCNVKTWLALEDSNRGNCLALRSVILTLVDKVITKWD